MCDEEAEHCFDELGPESSGQGIDWIERRQAWVLFGPSGVDTALLGAGDWKTVQNHALPLPTWAAPRWHCLTEDQ